jgi:SAM-dependent methyltransferase
MPNETIDAVLAGLEISEGDKVIAVSGTGLPPYMMYLKGANVIAVDNNPAQLEFAIKNYGNQDGLIFLQRDIFKSFSSLYDRYFQGEIIKVFLTNALVYEKEGKIPSRGMVNNAIREIGRKIAPGSLIYVTNHDQISELLLRGEVNFVMRGDKSIIEDSSFLPQYLKVDQELTLRARNLEWHRQWRPAVYRRL